MVLYGWLAITVNLYVRVSLDREEPPALWYIAPSVVLSLVLTIIAAAAGGITYDGVWCFIDSEREGMLFGCFYGEMIVVTVGATVLWVVLMRQMLRSLRLDRMKLLAASPSSSVNGASGETTRLMPRGAGASEPSTPAVDYASKRMLLIRQVVFVTSFLVIFHVMLINRLIIIGTGPSFAGWMAHGLCISLVGTCMFLVFGWTERNLQLWYSVFSGVHVAHPHLPHAGR
eukprot:Unigene10247_Nuclearia_a/m.31298 Unigene10247_Nuclearia_a/g.31298  ORF Unigene10247_Nuclearia_a/g.31298 Unigene10247_Nuclearia_a/m.31298 type:complete len:229 (+) Unigene10247_Nuclearia_a:341-1027(+)